MDCRCPFLLITTETFFSSNFRGASRRSDFLLNQPVPHLPPEALMEGTVVILGDRRGVSPKQQCNLELGSGSRPSSAPDQVTERSGSNSVWREGWVCWREEAQGKLAWRKFGQDVPLSHSGPLPYQSRRGFWWREEGSFRVFHEWSSELAGP